MRQAWVIAAVAPAALLLAVQELSSLRSRTMGTSPHSIIVAKVCAFVWPDGDEEE